MGSGTGQAEVVRRELSVSVVSHKSVAHSAIDAGQEPERSNLRFKREHSEARDLPVVGGKSPFHQLLARRGPKVSAAELLV